MMGYLYIFFNDLATAANCEHHLHTYTLIMSLCDVIPGEYSLDRVKCLHAFTLPPNMFSHTRLFNHTHHFYNALTILYGNVAKEPLTMVA